MNAPANIRPPVVDMYSATLDALRPCCGEVERRRRCGILYMRDRATAAIPVASFESSMILHTVASIASLHAFATMPPDQLDELHRSLVRLMQVAGALDTRGPRAEGMA